MDHPQKIKQLLDEGRLEEALAEAEALTAATPDDPSLLTTKGLILWRLQRRGEAISCYEKAAALDPEGPGARFLENARDVMDFFNPDLLNP